MKHNKTHVVIVLDRSSSMGSIKKQAVDGYNEQISQLKLDAKDSESGQIDVSLITFHSTVTEHLWCQPVEQAKEAAAEDYITEGMTALHDAIGHGITKMQNTVKDDDDTAYLFVIISDGQENQSREFSADQIKSLIESCEKTGRWTFTYMGCDKLELERVSQALGVKLDNMAAWEPSERGTKRAMGITRGKMATYMDSRKLGAVQCSNFHSEVVGLAADYTQDDGSDDADPIITQPVIDGINTVTDGSHPNVVEQTVTDATGVFKNGTTITWNK